MEITPFTGLGAIFFGETRQKVRRLVDSKCHAFRKDIGENETDAFDELGLHIYYDIEDRVEFIEAFDPALVTFRGVLFLGRSIDEVASAMSALGYSAIQTDVGLKYETVGIALTAPSGVIEGVGVFRRGYYNV